MVKQKELKLTSLKTDLLSALTIGIIAGLISPVVASNNNIKISPTVLFVGFVVLCVLGIVVARIASKYVRVLYKIGKFGEVGGLNWLLDIGVVNLLIMITGLSTGIYFVFFKATSFIVAATNSYLWNKFWVFDTGQKQKESQEIFKFITATLFSMGLNVAIASIVFFIGPKILTDINTVTWANLGVIFGSLGAMLTNFLLYKIWVFKDK